MTPTLRPLRDEDRAHVIPSWLRSYHDSDAARDVGKAQSRASLLAAYAALLDDRPKKTTTPLLYYSAHRRLIERLLSVSVVTVACYPADEDVILGWRAVQGDLLHYVCIKPIYWRQGLARLLVADLLDRPMTLTHWTDVCQSLPIPTNWTHKPTALKEALAA